ncbi:MAG: BON domain-containing protein [Methyloversatilis sp.]|jgi:hypothetical protein|nr:BON domain-containing protein [Methyloversatilis sp.]MBP6193929.1 BON domain-containing protein [Methyloversatilis sp.]
MPASAKRRYVVPNRCRGGHGGFVGTQADIDKAIAVVRAVGGVKSVKNDMRLKQARIDGRNTPCCDWCSGRFASAAST